MLHLALRLLGGFEARLGPLPLVLAKKTQALLTYLAIGGRVTYPRRDLATLLWGDTGEEQAQQSVRKALSLLRGALGQRTDEILVIRDSAVWLNLAAVEVDVLRFERLAAGATPAPLIEAAALYRGPLLAGVDIDEAPFEEWLAARREALRGTALNALSRLLAHQVRAAAPGPVIDTAARLLSLEPLHEPAHRALIQAYAWEGRRDAAARQYRVCVELLARELRVKPEAATDAAFRDALATGAPVASPGGHRVLLVEDDIVTRTHLTHLLEERGYTVVAAADGADALLKLSGEVFHLILSDIRMPFLDGLTLLGALQSKGIRTPVIIISGRRGGADEAQALQGGAADFITKPFDGEALLQRVEKAIGAAARP